MLRATAATTYNSKDIAEYIRKMPQVSFLNEHGEKFTLYSNGISVFMEGDEVDMMVDNKNKIEGIIQLFSPAFNIWSANELVKLGEAIKELGKKTNG